MKRCHSQTLFGKGLASQARAVICTLGLAVDKACPAPRKAGPDIPQVRPGIRKESNSLSVSNADSALMPGYFPDLRCRTLRRDLMHTVVWFADETTM
ncbi:hypothetical protein PSAB6_30397 [Paraburkholderia sabiae]|nr:hypothetical protein PSAB6_30397 [Paraburkholderia sabiae]